MPDYEVRHLNERGKMVWSQSITAEPDLLAIGIVAQSDNPHAKELWRGGQKVIDFPLQELEGAASMGLCRTSLSVA